MTSLKCLCNPLLCAKCPSEYKSLSHLRQHLGSKYKASRTQTFLVTQKHKELLTNCKKCNHRVAGKRWFSSICFPTEKVLQDHLTLAHRKVKISKCEESNSGSGVSDCACMKVFQCSFCSHSYSECSYLEKHWQATGHQPLHWQAALEDLQIKSKRTKVYCKKCSRENKAIMDNDTCPCRLTFLCSVCLTVFNSYTNLKNHWKMTNHHSDDDSENLSTEARGNDCLLCSPRRANSSLHLNEGSVFSSEDPTKTLSNNVTPWIEESVNGSIEKVELYSSLLKNITETKRSLKSNVQKRDLHHRESDLSSSKSALSSCTGSEDVLNSNSYEIIMNDIEEVDLETDDTLVTITISENKEDERNLHAECSAAVQITNNTFCEYPINLKDCFQQCLKFISAGCTCQRGNCVSSQENDFDLSKTADCSACCLEVNCFMCSNTFSSYYKLRDHLIKDHSLKINANMLSDPGSEYLHIIVKHLKVLNCNCAHYECKKCKETFQQRLVLLHHILSHHPQFYSTFSFFPFHSVACYTISCPQCAILEKLCTINYLLFIKVLLEIENCQKDKYTLLLDWCPSVKPVRHNVECLSEEPHKKAELLDSSRDGKVVCYCITQQTHSGKIVPRVKKMKHSVSECICPLLKCPTCPKTTATFGSLRKHIRLNNHNNWNMKLLWRKYKIIKENCSACGRFPYLDYILCPHCPHISFEDEEAAEAHMDSLHREKVNKCTGKKNMGCICAKHFLCMMCNTYFRTPQGLHHHMRRLGHETPENFVALPGMIKKKAKDAKKCPRCSLFMSSKTLHAGSDEDEGECSCKWAVCDTCGNSYKKICVLLDHMKKMGHPVNMDYIESERKKLTSSFKGCQKCNSMEDRYCIFCNTRENFIYHHMKTHHQDLQLMLLNSENGELFDEYDLECINRDSVKYECSICLKRFLHSTTLRNHVRKVHPESYFTLHCIDLGKERLKMEDFALRNEIKVLAIVNASEKR